MVIKLQLYNDGDECTEASFWNQLEVYFPKWSRPLVVHEKDGIRLDLKRRMERPKIENEQIFWQCDTFFQKYVPDEIEKLGMTLHDFDIVDLSLSMLCKDKYFQYVHEFILKCKPGVIVYLNDVLYDCKFDTIGAMKDILNHCKLVYVDFIFFEWLVQEGIQSNKLVTFLAPPDIN